MFHRPARFAHGGGNGDDGDDATGGGYASLPFTIEGDDLPYRIELWGPDGALDRVIAIAADATIGFAAYYAAARENPGRDVTITHKGRLLARWTRRSH